MAQQSFRSGPPGRTRPGKPLHVWKIGLLIAGGLVVGAALGCRDDEEIRAYQVPKQTPKSDARPNLKFRPAVVDMTGPGDGKSAGPVRLLGGIFPQPDRTWFFKLVGPKPRVDGLEKEFRHFLRSVRFTGKAKPPMTWTVPEGWKHEPGSGLRFATFRIGTDNLLELTVIGLGGEAGSLLANVNRWRNQIGLPALADADLGQVVHELSTEDAER